MEQLRFFFSGNANFSYLIRWAKRLGVRFFKGGARRLGSRGPFMGMRKPWDPRNAGILIFLVQYIHTWHLLLNNLKKEAGKVYMLPHIP